jgi:hypothetical protein
MKHVKQFAVNTADSQRDWKLKFPSHAVMDMDKIYDKISRYHKAVQRDPEHQQHARLVDDALKSFVSTLAKLHRAEEALY